MNWDWRSAKKSLPPLNYDVLGLTEKDQLVVVYLGHDSQWYLSYNNELVPTITHWIALPILIPC
jgi:hypothetical protein